MNAQDMRNAIRDVYPGERWKRKVDGMYDDQVIAIYHNFARSGKLNNPIEAKPKNTGPRQLSIFDFIKE